MCSQKSILRRRAETQNRISFVGGDWNAVLGSGGDLCDNKFVGEHGMGERNERGDSLAAFLSENMLSATNTYYPMQDSNKWTHKNGVHKRQIDFFCVCRRAKDMMTFSGAKDAIGVGADHRAVILCLKIRSEQEGGRRNARAARPKRPKRDPQDDYASHVESAIRSSTKMQSEEGGQPPAAAVCEELEECLKASVTQEGGKAEQTKQEQAKLPPNIRALMAERRAARRGEGEHRPMKVICKELQRAFRDFERQRKTEQIEQILGEFRNIGRIKDIHNNFKKMRLTSVVDKDGNVRSDRQGIVDVFADFYEDLYRAREGPAAGSDTDRRRDDTFIIPSVTAAEIGDHVTKLKKGKAADSKGIVAEMFKVGGEYLKQVLADVFTSILVHGDEPPESWRHNCVKVLFKKGDPKLPGNYRPITILPIMYKLFAMVLNRRLEAFLGRQQSADQAGFRKGYSCEDHLVTLTIIYEKAKEFNIDVWAAAVDFEKAFDSVNHTAIWNALREQGVPEPYVQVLKRLYTRQTGQVVSDCHSRTFVLGRGTKQGDPMSSTIFNAVLESLMRRLKEKWGAARIGFKMQPWTLTNLRFADDILLLGSTRAQVRRMLEDLNDAAAEVGLKIHTGKTKIMSNMQNRKGVLRQRHVRVGEAHVEVLPVEDSTAYLGRQLTLGYYYHDVEIRSRISKGWAAFGRFKGELCNKHYLLKSRFRLFDAVVSSAVLYGSGTWTLTAARSQKLNVAMRKMLRKIVGAARAPDESYVDWIKRATHHAEQEYERFGFPTWLQAQEVRKSKLFQKLQECTDRRWGSLALKWDPIGRRSTGRPAKRWTD